MIGESVRADIRDVVISDIWPLLLASVAFLARDTARDSIRPNLTTVRAEVTASIAAL